MNLFFDAEEQRLRAGWRLLIQFLLFFFLTGFISLGFRSVWESSLSIVTAIPQCIGTVASVWLAARVLDKRVLTDYGLVMNRCWWTDFVTGSGLGFFAMAAIFIVEWQLGWLSISGYGWHASAEYPFPIAFLSSLGAMLLVGFYEELFSRGYQLLNLSEGMRYRAIGGVRGAVIIATLATSAFFGLMHAFNPNVTAIAVFNIVLAGIVLAVPYVLTGSLGLSVGLHFSWNFAQGAVFGFPVSGTRLDAALIRIAQHGPETWTGGSFGPEAGITGIFGMAIMLGSTFVYIITSGRSPSIAALFKDGHGRVVKSGE